MITEVITVKSSISPKIPPLPECGLMFALPVMAGSFQETLRTRRGIHCHWVDEDGAHGAVCGPTL